MGIEFNKVIVAANDLLSCQNIVSLKINPISLILSEHIIIDTMTNYCNLIRLDKSWLTCEGELLDGYTVKRNGICLILYNELIRSQERINWTVAHEIGHVYMNHDHNGDKEEVEGHFFAAQLLMPEQVILSFIKAEIEISKNFLIQTFGVSDEAAEKRLATLQHKCIEKYCNIDSRLECKYSHLISEVTRKNRTKKSFKNHSNQKITSEDEMQLLKLEEAYLYDF